MLRYVIQNKQEVVIMEFIEIKPTKIRSNNDYLRKIVRASFTKPKSKDSVFSLSIYIGKDIANKLDLKKNDKVSISYGAEDQRIWLIKKSIGSGYKLLDTKDSSPALKFQLTWRLFEPKQNEIGAREIKIKESNSEKIIVDAN